jgi:hypothetical protein
MMKIINLLPEDVALWLKIMLENSFKIYHHDDPQELTRTRTLVIVDSDVIVDIFL